jgi:hypothetical protein
MAQPVAYLVEGMQDRGIDCGQIGNCVQHTNPTSVIH